MGIFDYPVMFPDVDVIIPTLNAESTIDKSLRGLNNQDYQGRIMITIVDGGSTDKTIEIAQRYDTKIITKPGMYGTGKNGARHFGEMITQSAFVWNIDSDNIIVEPTVLSRLVTPLIEDQTLNISAPTTALDKTSSSFNRWTSLVEIKNVENMVKRGTSKENGYVFLSNINYGLTNCSLLRRSVLNLCGGYDSDVRLLRRIQRLGLAKGVIDLQSHFYHNQTTSVLNYLRKLDKRFKRFGKMSNNELIEYFVEYPPLEVDNSKLRKDSIKSLIYDPLIQISHFFREPDLAWLWGLPFSLLFILYISMHPILSNNVFKRFL